ncbi:MAG: DUF421 domain-containing protein [Clostridia bacterium]|nr:DUF421 domain-containing protein [Clostridia bacterium]
MSISVIRTIILYLLIVLAMRIMGKRQLGELQPTELVVTLLLSDLASVPMQDNGLPLLNGILPILVLVAMELLISGLMLKLPSLSRLISGSPVPIIKDGHVDKKAMQQLRITVDDLVESLRQQDIFDLQQVQYAIAETNGHISAFCYPRFQSATIGDVRGDTEDTGMPVVVISDGRLSDWGMTLCELKKTHVQKILRENHCRQEEVFLLTVTKTGDYFLLTHEQAKGDNA